MILCFAHANPLAKDEATALSSQQEFSVVDPVLAGLDKSCGEIM